MVIAFSIIFAVAVVGLFAGLYIRRRTMSFEGTVTDKDVQEIRGTSRNNMPVGTISLGNQNSGDVTRNYMIKVETTTGKKVSWQVSQGKYEIIKIGDRVSKAKGTTDIEITPQTQQSTTPTPPPATPIAPSI